MKILLIQPQKAEISLGGEDLHIFEPLALEYIGAGVSGKHEVRLLDLRLDRYLQGTLLSFQPDIVGVTSYTVHVNPVKDIFRQVKEWNNQTLTVVGGHHATILPEDFISPDIDLIVMGEGVSAFRGIVERHEKEKDFSGIPGVTYAENDELVTREYAREIDLDTVPFPDRSLTSRYRSQYYSEWMKPLASIRTSKGCPFHCNFCALWKISGGKYFKRSPESIVEELAEINEPYVFFADDESMVDAERMKTLATLIKDAGINKRYFLYGRSDTIVRNPALIKQWRDIGLAKVFVGLEFFRDEDLEYVGKKTTVNDNKEAIKVLQDLGIEPYPTMIIRQEWQQDDFKELKQYCKQLGLSYGAFTVLTPLPGTDLYEETKDKLITDNRDYFDLIHTVLPTRLPMKDFYEEYHRLVTGVASIGKSLGYLRNYPLKEIPGAVSGFRRHYKRLRKAYLDYSNR